ncbi:hypothetical protein [Bradyrhizobium australiense]|uniref:Uncharacterized protein n=1 Tax=Bradyrhizobium australiense TaxID=2721161 RepID=A0A7Y4GUL6_9BRAD|nr:hypothetical protein [Bradyrhizobium australiense]NOJ42235.1 hypothetical protein [Bradyrhizobium australiense]
MAKLVGVWIYEEPRSPSDDVKLQGGATLILSEQERRKIGDNLMKVSIRVMDDDFAFDDELYKDDSFQLGPANLNVGPTTFGFSATVAHSKVANSETSSESWAELYFRVRASGGGVTTKWANSQNEDVQFE